MVVVIDVISHDECAIQSRKVHDLPGGRLPEDRVYNAAGVNLSRNVTGVVDAPTVIPRISVALWRADKAGAGRPKKRDLSAICIEPLSANLAGGIDLLAFGPSATGQRPEIDHSAGGCPNESMAGDIVGEVRIAHHFSTVVNTKRITRVAPQRAKICQSAATIPDEGMILLRVR